ncbi:MAG: hypothetical protein QOJ40_2290 [Verrucomicrobiota bacterium]
MKPKQNKPTAVVSPLELQTSPLDIGPALNSQPTSLHLTVIDAKPLTPAGSGAMSPATRAPNKSRRKGRVASLPKVQRDMVNHMLWNGIAYKNIVAALDDAGFTLIERNISNWATGGYIEWRLEQEAVLDNRLNQDHLLDFLRRDDASELPEVGLQAAATRLSQVLMQKLAHADDPEANLDNYSKLIDLVCRLNRELATTQKQRDDGRRTLGREHDPVFVKDVEQVNAIEMERSYSNPCSESELPRPAVPPLLPQIPTATFLAEQAAEERHDREIARLKHTNELMKKLTQKAKSAA